MRWFLVGRFNDQEGKKPTPSPPLLLVSWCIPDFFIHCIIQEEGTQSRPFLTLNANHQNLEKFTGVIKRGSTNKISSSASLPSVMFYTWRKNIASVRNCPDIRILNSLFGFWCPFILLTFSFLNHLFHGVCALRGCTKSQTRRACQIKQMQRLN